MLRHAASLLLWSCVACAVPRAGGQTQDGDDRMAWWRQARFGMFIHWGLYAIPAGRWGDQTGHGEWIRDTAQIPVETYERLAERFDPVKFEAAAWAGLAREAGMRYLVITSKHHDGFCLFDSAHTGWDVMSTPWGHDVMGEIAQACRDAGLRVGWYYSIMDWHHPDYLPRRGWESRPVHGADFERYVSYLHGQVGELLGGRYGRVDVMWFDGEWEDTWTHRHGLALNELCRRLQPSCLVNNRVDKGRAGMAGLTAGEGFAGDFGTPEQEVPPAAIPVDWETCMTLNDHWGFNAADGNWKSAAQLVRTLAEVASKGGNLLLNVGPTAQGEIPGPCVERLREVGRWMSVNGESIHGTSAGPFARLPWGTCTARAGAGSTTLYLHVNQWPSDGALVVPGLSNEPVAAHLLGAKGQPLRVRRAEADLVISLPADPPEGMCPVVTLTVAGTAKAVPAP